MSLIADNLSYLEAREKTDPKFKLMLERMLVASYSEFVSVLYRDLEEIIDIVQSRKQFLQEANEDAITVQIVDALVARNYQATHDTKQGGHVDIYVSGKESSWQWLGEAKICTGSQNAWLEKGFRQLCQRYSDGAHNHEHGGILAYVKGKNAKKVCDDWRAHVATLSADFDAIEVVDCPLSLPNRFVSSHNHESSGLPYKVKHFFMALYHSPTV